MRDDKVTSDMVPPQDPTFGIPVPSSLTPARWFSEAEKWVHDFGVENENIACDRIVHAAVVGTHAYVVLSATLSFSLKGGQTGSRPGILTFTFGKQGDKWMVETQAWGRLS